MIFWEISWLIPEWETNSVRTGRIGESFGHYLVGNILQGFEDNVAGVDSNIGKDALFYVGFRSYLKVVGVDHFDTQFDFTFWEWVIGEVVCHGISVAWGKKDVKCGIGDFQFLKIL